MRRQLSMPSPSTSTLRIPSASRSSLSHSITVRPGMAAGPIGTTSSSRPCPMTNPPGCWERWRGNPTRVRATARACRSRGAPGSSPRARTASSPGTSPAGVGGEDGGHLLGEPEGLARFAEGEPGPEVDHRRGEGGPVPPPSLVHVLDHLLPALVLEVDVDVRRLAPLLGHEALEQEVAPGRVDGGDPEHVAHRGVGRRPPPLGEDPARPREAHEVVHGEEVGRVAEPGDDPELALELGSPPGRGPRTP